MNTPVPSGAAASTTPAPSRRPPADRSARAGHRHLRGARAATTTSLTSRCAKRSPSSTTGSPVASLIPGDPGWDEARTAWNLAVDQRPVAVVVAGSVDDIVQTVRTAKRPRPLGRTAGAPATTPARSPRRTASPTRCCCARPSCAACRSTPTCASPASSPVRSGATSSPRSRRTDSPRSPDRRTTSACVGYTLGGGVSWLGRSHGLAANSRARRRARHGRRRAPPGRRRRTTPSCSGRVRGGGGDFGVVTALEFRAVPGRRDRRRHAVLPARARRGGAAGVGRVDRRACPTPSRRSVACSASRRCPSCRRSSRASRSWSSRRRSRSRPSGPTSCSRRCAPSAPEIDSVHPQPIAELLQLHMDPPAPMPGYGDGMLLAELPPDAVRAFVAAVGPDSGSALLSAEIRHVGGGARPEAAHATRRRARHARTGCRRRVRRGVPRVRRGHRDARAPTRRSRHPSAGCSRASSRGVHRSTTSTSPSTSAPAERLFGDRRRTACAR